MKIRESEIIAEGVGLAVASVVGKALKPIFKKAVLRSQISRASKQANEVQRRVNEVQDE